MTYNHDTLNLPKRTAKPRKAGMTMVMDKGLSLRQVEDYLDTSSDFVDVVKLGFGTSIITKHLKEKINLYKQAGIKTYLGGTLFEAFVVRNQFDEYVKFVQS